MGRQRWSVGEHVGHARQAATPQGDRVEEVDLEGLAPELQERLALLVGVPRRVPPGRVQVQPPLPAREPEHDVLPEQAPEVPRQLLDPLGGQPLLGALLGLEVDPRPRLDLVLELAHAISPLRTTSPAPG